MDDTERFSDEDLALIDAWCDAALNAYKDGRSYGVTLCKYTDALPTKSIRSSMAALARELRGERARASQLADALRDSANLVHWDHAAPTKPLFDDCIFPACIRARNALSGVVSSTQPEATK